MALVDKLKQINFLNSQWQALQPMTIENEKRLWDKIRLDWNFNSNHIEGNTLTYGETMLLLIFDKTTGDHELREYEEMKAHDVAIHMVKEWAKNKSRDLTEADIRELNKIILVQPYWKDAITAEGQPTRRLIKVGEYKEHPNSVRLKNGEIFQYASPFETPLKMAELLKGYRKEGDNPDNVLLLVSKFHYEFVEIHPFDDGNGRVARLIANYILMKFGTPPIIVKANEKEKYLTALNKADTGDIGAFHEYMADQVIWSLNIAIKAAKGESIEEADDIDKRVALLNYKLTGMNEPIKKIKNNEVMTEMLKEVIEPLFRKVFEKALKISPLFVSTKFTYHIDGSGGVHDNINELIENIEIGWIQSEGDIQNIDLYIYLSGLKKLGIRAFDISEQLRINFEKHKYQIILNNSTTESVERLYHQMLTPIENNEIATKLINDAMNKIEQVVERYTKK